MASESWGRSPSPDSPFLHCPRPGFESAKGVGFWPKDPLGALPCPLPWSSNAVPATWPLPVLASTLTSGILQPSPAQLCPSLTVSADGGGKGQEPDGALVGDIFNVRAGPHSARTVLGLGCPVPACWVGHAMEEARMKGRVSEPAGEGAFTQPLQGPVFSLPAPCCPPPHPTTSELPSSSCDAKNRVCC